MTVHLQLVLLVAVLAVVPASRIQPRLKENLETEVKQASLPSARSKHVEELKQSSAAVEDGDSKQAASSRPHHAPNLLHSTASLVQSKASSVHMPKAISAHTSMAHATQSAEEDSQHEAHATQSAQQDSHQAHATQSVQEDSHQAHATQSAKEDAQQVHATQLVRQDLQQDMASLISGWLHGLPGNGMLNRSSSSGSENQTRNLFIMAGVSVLFVLVCCCSYFLFDHLFLKKESQRNESDRKKKDQKKHAQIVGFEKRVPYVFQGREVFDWEQSAACVKLYVKVPDGITKNALDIKIGAHSLQIGCVGKEPFMKEEVYDTVNVEESQWRLRSNGELQIMLQKDDNSIWPRVLK